MLNIKINDTDYNIPTGYEDVTFKQYAKVVDLKEGSINQKLELRTGLPIELIDFMTFEQLSILIPLVGFFDTEPEYHKEIAIDVDIASESYEKLEQSKMALQNGSFTAVIEMCKIYLDKDISELSVVDAFGYASFFFKSSQHLPSDSKD